MVVVCCFNMKTKQHLICANARIYSRGKSSEFFFTHSEENSTSDYMQKRLSQSNKSVAEISL